MAYKCDKCGKNFKTEKEAEAHEKKCNVVLTKPHYQKDWLVVLLLCIFLGVLGVHRFYVGKIGTGILYFFTFGFFGIGVLIDFITILTNSFTNKRGDFIIRD